MNRNEELENLLRDVETKNFDINPLVKKAKTRRRTIVGIRSALFSVVAVFVALVFVVNTFPTVAYAMGRIPILRDIAKFVAVSPSLSAAIDNEYVQPIDMQQTKDGITVDVQYVIVDKMYANFFLTVQSDEHGTLPVEAEFFGADGEEFGRIMYETRRDEDKVISVIQMREDEMPEDLKLVVNIPVWNSMRSDFSYGEYLTSFEFDISFDPNFVDSGTLYEIDEEFELSPQHSIHVKSVEVYPSNSRLILDVGGNGEYAFENMKFYVKNEHGETFEHIGATFGEGDKLTYEFETIYFDDAKSYDLYISDASWTHERETRTVIDIEQKSASGLPEGIELSNVRKSGNGYKLEFIGEYSAFPTGELVLDVGFDSEAQNENGESFTGGISSFQTSLPEDDSKFVLTLEIYGFEGTEISFKTFEISYTVYDPPAKINLIGGTP